MNISIILAQIFGISFMVLGLSMLLNKKWTSIAVEKIIDNPGIIWLAGLITILLGSTTVVLNNFWTYGLPLVITILGWLMLAKGTIILVFPKLTSSYYKKMNKGNIFMWGGIVVLVFSLLLLYSA